MARIGLKYPKYAVVTVTVDESTGAETETYGTVKTAGRAVSADISINVSDNKFYADDNVAETDPEFIDGTLTMGLDELENAVAAELCGAALDSGSSGSGDITFGAEDAAPYVRFGFIVPIMHRGARKWIGIVLCRVKFGPPQDSFQTKGENVEFAGASITGDIMKNADGKWRIQSAWKDTETAALTWLTGKVAPSA